VKTVFFEPFKFSIQVGADVLPPEQYICPFLTENLKG